MQTVTVYLKGGNELTFEASDDSSITTSTEPGPKHGKIVGYKFGRDGTATNAIYLDFDEIAAIKVVGDRPLESIEDVELEPLITPMV